MNPGDVVLIRFPQTDLKIWKAPPGFDYCCGSWSSFRFVVGLDYISAERLQSHLIPINELANGGYMGLSQEEKHRKLASDFEAFTFRRAELVMKAVRLLADGHQLNIGMIYGRD